MIIMNVEFSSTDLIIGVAGVIGFIIEGFMGYFLTQTMDRLKASESLGIETQRDLHVLKNDHENKYIQLTNHFERLSRSLDDNTKEMKEYTKEMREFREIVLEKLASH